ncbi:winged helix-turn-helix domain-containing protein [Streptomyces somaliensis DSM 40738]|uniref:Winged helix-turn-helix transcriptional regulator n=1 Tax=Streptomyces somaliensis (strain ATCC 33201 / DSM 40738 / JCM 12659 / KCTC 9044 / NCTC 11332 / NRRL B-12077 / IP 733) TaxID=1134445 RepID=A0AA44DED0_STRE0|nr:winged helix-turn-helix domain-containing protein [Streptomyces somaliensis]MCQ0022988.1 winged helix-turn-helix domain-containing protein [Streptomyces somaliensis DSM 40738]NKY15328.1 winged helix-turn-helix transcriptional regulator [Streptomyces somaliensis DSM 40738]
MIEFDPTKPKWAQIADEIRKRIETGELPPQALISEVRLEEEFGVARTTVRKATAALREEGLITTTPGMGSFVAVPPEGGAPAL